MAEASPSIFNKRATEKLRSPDDLDKYVRVTNPSLWIVLAACIALLGGLLAWGVFGAVTTSVSTTGVVISTSKIPRNVETQAVDFTDGKNIAICFLSGEDVAKVNVGNTATVDTAQMQVKGISKIPASPDEWYDALGSQYLATTLFSGDWAYPVVFEGDTSELDVGVPLTVHITTERVAPISLILKNWG